MRSRQTDIGEVLLQIRTARPAATCSSLRLHLVLHRQKAHKVEEATDVAGRRVPSPVQPMRDHTKLLHHRLAVDFFVGVAGGAPLFILVVTDLHGS